MALFTLFGTLYDVLLVFAIVSVLYIVHSFWVVGGLRRNGILGPTPLPIIGNLSTIIRKGINKASCEWERQYGQIYGFYIGQRPVVVISDLDVIRQVLVRDFSIFTDRSLHGSLPHPVDKAVFFMFGDSWKRVRNIITPTFSAGKLKMMCSDINRCSKTLTANLERQAGTGVNVDVFKLFGAYTMDVIAATSFGIQVQSQFQSDDPFIKNVKSIFDRTPELQLGILLPALFPWFQPFAKMLKFGFWPLEALTFFDSSMRAMIEDRKRNPSERLDFLQLLLKAEADNSLLAQSANETTAVTRQRLTTDEIIGQGFNFFLAGYETTGSLLRYVAYVLAIYPDIQDQMYDEIQNVLKETEPTYANVAELQFMDQVLHETLRMYPPVPVFNRMPSEDVYIKGRKISKGVQVQIPVYRIHHNPSVYHDPERFLPERFATENKSQMHPASFLSFGMGPRNCLGIRLGLLEAKIALADVLRKVRFVTCPQTEIPLPVEVELVLLKPKRPVLVRIEKRT